MAGATEPQPQQTARESAPALLADRVSARYTQGGRLALTDVSLRVAPGEKLLLVGPNGAGKSTLLRLCAGQMRATSGSLLLFGQPPSQGRHLVGVVSHATYLYDELTPAENLGLYGALYGVSRPQERSADLLRQLGLSKLSAVPVGQLSRGQQQRVALARALLHDPPLLLLDEPETGLDAGALAVLEQLAQEQERTIVLATHQVHTGRRLASRVAVLVGGRLAPLAGAWQEEGTLETLLRDLALGATKR